ncbi:hypothetical protein L3C95_11585 [Chitinophaga filiformis]|uniref:hypothetical protein n=1 Tax=Chitinophaga filiformis TaxID=104663 RepID=UPI001F449392|nr:hypothetical protein [Chitinophaga filiformis]MCF6402561.1 hypothetical protein [Chitinophaga filiformis]MCF6403521.1 hypothetical protein [Chitinophaga filiformis]
MKFPDKNNLIATLVPVVFALIVRGLFSETVPGDFFKLMTFAFLFFVPFGLGALAIKLAPIEKVYSRAYRICMPWLPLSIFFIVTILLKIEGWACWIMIMPLFLVAASIGGLIAGHYKIKKHKNEKMYISLILLLPLFISPIEQRIAKIPGRYKADTYIDIHANKEQIWNNVTRVREISEAQDKGWFTRFLGFPRPIKAELNFEGPGAFRKAIFDKGLIFDETVTDYLHQQKMSFTIKANPYDIPSTTMDEHIVVGGDYFDVLNGTYELEALNDHTYRLHLYSHFKLTTSFNFYASWWAGWIMEDIQNNILQIVKQRAEHGN